MTIMLSIWRFDALWDYNLLLKKHDMLLRITGSYDKMMICKTRVPRIVSGLRLCIKRIKKSHNTNINSPLVRHITNNVYVSFVQYLFKTMHHGQELKFPGTK